MKKLIKKAAVAWVVPIILRKITETLVEYKANRDRKAAERFQKHWAVDDERL